MEFQYSTRDICCCRCADAMSALDALSLYHSVCSPWPQTDKPITVRAQRVKLRHLLAFYMLLEQSRAANGIGDADPYCLASLHHKPWCGTKSAHPGPDFKH